MRRCLHSSSLIFWGLYLSAQVFYPTSSSAQSTRFVREEISISVLGESCIVTGEYHFRNESGDTVANQILYPFPHLAGLPEPTTIEAEDLSTHSHVGVSKIAHAALFWISLPPHSERPFRIRYVQPTPSRLMSYILTSTRSWGRPLERATFRLLLPHRYTLTSLSIPADSSWESEEGRTYLLQKACFMPTVNLTFRWKER
jgi:hypothetical protein